MPHALCQQKAVDGKGHTADDAAGIVNLRHLWDLQFQQNGGAKVVDQHGDAGDQFQHFLGKYFLFGDYLVKLLRRLVIKKV